MPVRSSVAGALSQGLRMKEEVRSSLAMIKGGKNRAGTAMATLDGITCIKASFAAAVEEPTSVPSSNEMPIPSFTSLPHERNVYTIGCSDSDEGDESTNNAS